MDFKRSLDLLILGAAQLSAGRTLAAAATAPATAPSDAPAVINVRDLGAFGDGKTLDTDAINRAIQQAAASPGGGVVHFPAGDYLSASIHLQSRVTLQLDRGAVIEAADPRSTPGFDAPEPNPAAGRYQDFSHSHWHDSLIWGDSLHDIGIIGPGQIRGDRLVFKGKQKIPVANKTIGLKNCTGVTLRDLTILNGGHFGVLATGVSDMTIQGLTVDTNRDGIDLDACQRVEIRECAVNAPFDDGICLKSSWALGRAVALEDVSILNCSLSGYDPGTWVDGTRRLTAFAQSADGPVSRIKLGTESAGGFRNVSVRDCRFDHTRGLAIESVDGGVLDHVVVDGLTMRHVTDAPIFIRLGSRMRRPRGPATVSALQHVTLAHINASDIRSRFPVIIAGLNGHAIQDVAMENVTLEFVGGGLMPAPTTQPLMNDRMYPEPENFGDLPAWGMYVADVDGLRLDHVTLRTVAPDARHVIVARQANQVSLTDAFAESAGKPIPLAAANFAPAPEAALPSPE